MKRTALILILISALLISVFLGGVLLVAQTLPAHQVMMPSQSPVAQSAPTNQTSPSPTESPAPTPSSEAQITPQPASNTTTPTSYPRTVRTSYTPLPQPTPEEGIAIVSVTYYSAGDTFLRRFIESIVTNVTVINFGQDYVTVTSITCAPNSQSKTFNVVIPPNSTVDIPTIFFPNHWSSGMRFYVVVTTAEGYSAASSEFEFPISDY